MTLRAAIADYARHNYPAEHFADAECHCGHRIFAVTADEDAGVAIRVCTSCGAEHLIGDSADFVEEAELDGYAECLCGETHRFEVCVGVALYEDSEDVKWLYLGLRCTACGVAGVYADWKNEYDNYVELLGRV